MGFWGGVLNNLILFLALCSNELHYNKQSFSATVFLYGILMKVTIRAGFEEGMPFLLNVQIIHCQRR